MASETVFPVVIGGVIITSVWVFFDAKKRDSVPVICLGTLIPTHWLYTLFSLTFWVFGFPYYLYHRHQCLNQSGAETPVKLRREPVIAFILSVVWPGMGQLYLGKIADGICVMLTGPFLIIMAFCGYHIALYILPFFYIAVPLRTLYDTVQNNKALDRDTQTATIQCPHCAETIKAAARVCRYCQRNIDKEPPKEGKQPE